MTPARARRPEMLLEGAARCPLPVAHWKLETGNW
jgi:hypothetical protein